MAADKIKDSKLAGMTSRQKATIGAFVVIVLIIIWQVWAMFKGETTEATFVPPTPPAGQMSAAAPGGAQPAAAPAAPGAPPGAMTGAAPGMPGQPGRPPAQTLRQAPVTMDAQLLEMQKQNEQQYIDQLNKLQTLKIQKEIEETNQAIASARLATVTAEKSVTDLLTRPAQPVIQGPAVPAGAYANILTTPVPSGTTVTTTETEVPPPPVTAPEISYSVISVSMQLGRWSAVIGSQGKLFNVTVGDILPLDGSVVASISRNGVTLVKDGKRRKVSITSSI